MKFAKFTVLTSLLSFSLVNPAIAESRLEREYKVQAQKREVQSQRQKKAVYDRLSKAAEKPRQAYLQALAARYPGLQKTLTEQVKGIMASRQAANLKTKAIAALLDKHRMELRAPMNEIEPALRAYRLEAQAVLRAFKCMFDAYFNVLCSEGRAPDISIPQDVTYTAAYSAKEELLSSNLIGFGNANANHYSGFLTLKAVAVDAGSFFAKGGMVETFDVPPQIDRVKVTVKATVNWSVIAFSILGISWGDASAYLTVYGDNSFKCDKNHTLAFSLAPVLWIQNNSGEQVTSLTCEFTPNQSGGQYVLAGGAKSGVGAVFPSATLSDVGGHVDEIRVQFINE